MVNSKQYKVRNVSEANLPNMDSNWTIGALKAGVSSAVVAVDREREALAHAVTAQLMVTDEQSDAGAFSAHLDRVRAGLWPEDPLDGYGRHSSIGAYLVCRHALEALALEEITLREDPMATEQLREILEDVDDHIWLDGLFEAWTNVSESFVARSEGLSVSELAGLAESALTLSDKHKCLSQLSFSASCASRLLEARKAVRNTQQVLSIIPSSDDDLGAGYVLAMAALAMHLPERALELTEQDPPDFHLGSALQEIARAQAALLAGESGTLADDPALPSIVFEPVALSETAVVAEAAEDMEAEDAYDDEEAILEIVEDVAENPENEAAASSVPLLRPPTWRSTNDLEVIIDEDNLRLWSTARQERQSVYGQLGDVLGLSVPDDGRRLAGIPPDMLTISKMFEQNSEPPDPSLAETERVDVAEFLKSQREDLGCYSVAPLLQIVRVCLRAITTSAEGLIPSSEFLACSGDAHATLARARRLALLANGRLEEASRVLGVMDSQTLDELKFELIAKFRFDGRYEQLPAEFELLSRTRARQVAASMVSDLALALGRTIAGISN